MMCKSNTCKQVAHNMKIAFDKAFIFCLLTAVVLCLIFYEETDSLTKVKIVSTSVPNSKNNKKT